MLFSVCSINDNNTNGASDTHLANAQKAGILMRIKYDRYSDNILAFFRIFSGIKSNRKEEQVEWINLSNSNT